MYGAVTLIVSAKERSWVRHNPWDNMHNEKAKVPPRLTLNTDYVSCRGRVSDRDKGNRIASWMCKAFAIPYWVFKETNTVFLFELQETSEQLRSNYDLNRDDSSFLYINIYIHFKLDKVAKPQMPNFHSTSTFVVNLQSQSRVKRSVALFHTPGKMS